MSSQAKVSAARAGSYQLTRSFSVPKMEARCSAISAQLLEGLCQGLWMGGEPLRVFDAPVGAPSPAQSSKAAFCAQGKGQSGRRHECEPQPQPTSRLGSVSSLLAHSKPHLGFYFKSAKTGDDDCCSCVQCALA